MIIGHQKQLQILRKSLKLNRLSHAYLFAGTDSLGKKTLALKFIKLINCQSRDFNKKPCQQCNPCQMIEKRRYPDLFIVEPDKGKKSIQISQIRELQHFLSYRPYVGVFKAVILDEAEKMNNEAQSCFLKTLEEPKGKTLLILISSHPEMLLSTIYSRCQIIKFFPVRKVEIKKYLIGQGASEKRAQILSALCQGKPGKAIDFLLNPEKLTRESQIFKEILKICHSDFSTRFQYAKNLTLKDSPLNLNEFLEILQRYFRYILFSKTGISTGTIPEILPLEYFPSPSEKLKSYSISRLKKIIKWSQTINFLISSTNINQKLALEVLLMQL